MKILENAMKWKLMSATTGGADEIGELGNSPETGSLGKRKLSSDDEGDNYVA